MLEYLASIMDARRQRADVRRCRRRPGACASRRAPASAPIARCSRPGRSCSDSGDFKAKAGALDDKTRWLLGEQADALFEAQSVAATRLAGRAAAFPTAATTSSAATSRPDAKSAWSSTRGRSAIRPSPRTAMPTRCRSRLSVGGLEFLVDPGTYAYHTQGAWRAVLPRHRRRTTPCAWMAWTSRSPAAISCGCARRAQAAACGASSRLEDLFEGWQDGYRRLADPVMHHRRIVLRQGRAAGDHRGYAVQMSGEHDIELLFHCSEQLPGRGCSRRLPAAPGRQVGPAQAAAASRRGTAARLHRQRRADLRLGVAGGFDDKQPAPTIVWQGRLAGDVSCAAIAAIAC